jgi:hypothetical protein
VEPLIARRSTGEVPDEFLHYRCLPMLGPGGLELVQTLQESLGVAGVLQEVRADRNLGIPVWNGREPCGLVAENLALELKEHDEVGHALRDREAVRDDGRDREGGAHGLVRPWNDNSDCHCKRSQLALAPIY